MTQKTISEILNDGLNKSPFISFDDLTKKLENLRYQLFPALTLERNKIAIGDFSLDQLKIAIEQYSTFSNEAIHMLLDARIRSTEWPKMSTEIGENIEEELGKFTKGVPHLVMMRRGYLNDLGIKTDSVNPLYFSEYFLRNMRLTFKVSVPSFLAGALVAFEGCAIQEFAIVEEIIKKYNGGTISGLTEEYIKGHQEFEIGHEQHLKDSISEYINESNYIFFCKGYIAVCLELDHWWNSLHQYLFYSSYFDYLKS
jgi:hypothetical protein